MIGAKVCRNCGNARSAHTLVDNCLECPAENYALCRITGVHTVRQDDENNTCIYCNCNVLDLMNRSIPR